MKVYRLILPFLLLLSMGGMGYAQECNDLSIDPESVVFAENRDSRTFSLYLVNDSGETFDIDDSKVEESDSQFNVSIKSVPGRVNGNSTSRISMEYSTNDVNGDYESTFKLRIKGEFDDEDVTCSFSQLSFTIDVLIEDGQNACSIVDVISEDVSIQEETTISHTITIINNTSDDFEIQDLDIFEGSSDFTIKLETLETDDDFESIIPAKGERTYPVTIESNRVGEDVTETVFIEIRGEFEDGLDCSFSEINGEFDVTIEDSGIEGGLCSEIRVDNSQLMIISNQTLAQTISLSNNGNENFYIDEFLLTDQNYQALFTPLSAPNSITPDETKSLALNTTGYLYPENFNANAYLTIKGHFTNGTACFISNAKIPFAFTGYQNGTCGEIIIEPQQTILKGTSQLPLLIHNPLNEILSVYLSINTGTVTPERITIPPKTNKLYTITVHSQEEGAELQVRIDSPACQGQKETITVWFSRNENNPIEITNSPEKIESGGSREFAIQLTNKSFYSKEAVITLIAKPTNQTFQKKITLNGYDELTVFLPISTLENAVIAILQVESEGYITTKTIQIEGNNIPITAQENILPNNQNQYTVIVSVANPTNQAVNGKIEATLPEEWDSTIPSNVTINPNETKTIVFSIIPDKILNKPETIYVQFKAGLSSSEPYQITLSPSNALNSATAFLSGENQLGLGIAILVILALLWILAKPERKMEYPPI